MSMKCEDCRFWEQDGEHTFLGFCRRYAPRPALSTPMEGAGAMDAIWLRTKSEERCGEWVAKIEVQEER